MLAACQWYWHRFEDGLLVALMAAMVLVSLAQIALRNLFAYSLSWAEPLVQVLLLWMAMVGALVATRQRRHLHIDLVLRLTPAPWHPGLRAVAAAVSCLVCGILTWVAVRFVQGEAQAGTLGVFSVPTWQLQLVFPFTFAVMSLRFAAQALGETRPGAEGNTV